nr:hypothetical protein [Tanacetum cinerariifolium]
MTSLTSMCELACQIVQKKLEEKQLEEEQAAKAQSWKLPVCYDDDDDEESSNSLEDNIICELPSCIAAYFSPLFPNNTLDNSLPPTPLLTAPKESGNPQLSRRINGEDGDPKSHRG